MAIQMAGSLGSEPLARARQLFYGLPKATRQATLGIVTRGALLFGVELDGGALIARSLGSEFLGRARQFLFMGSRKRRARQR